MKFLIFVAELKSALNLYCYQQINFNFNIYRNRKETFAAIVLFRSNKIKISIFQAQLRCIKKKKKKKRENMIGTGVKDYDVKTFRAHVKPCHECHMVTLVIPAQSVFIHAFVIKSVDPLNGIDFAGSIVHLVHVSA